MQTDTRLSKRWRLLAAIALSAVVGVLAAGVATERLSLFPPELKPSEWQIAAASTHVMVDAPEPLTDRRALPQDVDSLAKHAELLGRVMASPPIVERIARIAGVDSDEIAAVAPATFGPRVLTEAASEQRANELLASRSPYRIEVQSRPTLPIIDVYTQAPSPEAARRLADAAVTGLGEYVRDLADRQGFEGEEPLTMRQLGRAHAEVVNGGTELTVAVLAFLIGFGLTLGGLVLFARLRVRPARPALPSRPVGRPADAPADDDWPHTTRVLPWMLAAFIAVLWLVPFDSIELGAALPIDLKFDRLVLPIVAGTWVLAMAVGGRAAPRVRPTWIHAAIGVFVVCAFLSVLHNAPVLNQDLEFDLAFKELPLLLSYVSLFLIAASVVRPSEVRAYLGYTLLLAVVCAVGILWEYRFKQNLFYDWADKLLPGAFNVGEAEAGAVDDAGRRLVRGPGALPLEAVAMLSMALPIALVRVMQSRELRARVLYAIAACLLLAAMLATYRKSALLAPVSVFLTFAYFRRRELLKLAPVALLLVVMIQILAPGALRMTTSQFSPDQLGVATVSDRAVDYDAVRPDLWSNLVFGRGWGSYDSATHRILDSELLHRVVEMGVIGLLAYLLMGIAVVLAARKTIANRHPEWGPPALVGAAVAVSFLVVSMLFDVLSFPHSPYIFFYVSGLVAAVLARQGTPAAKGPVRAHADVRRPRTAVPPLRAGGGRLARRP